MTATDWKFPRSWLRAFFANALEYPDTRAVITAEETLSYSDLAGMAGSAAEWVDGFALPAGTVVPALVDRVGPSISLLIGAACAGTPTAPLGVRLTPKELSAIVTRLDAPVLVTQPEHLPLANDVAALSSVAVRVLPPLEVGRPPTPPRPDSTIAVLHTSGTTGLPKRVDAADGALALRRDVLRDLFDLRRGDTLLISGALHHVAGFANLTLGLDVGATVAAFPRFSPAAWEALKGAGITHASTVPSMIVALLSAGVLDVHPRLRALLYGGGPMRADVLEETREVLPDVRLLQLFGQTEGTPLTALTPSDHDLAVNGRTDLLRSVGRAAPGVTLHLDGVDQDGLGEVWARGQHLYKTGEDGWLRTGDLGYIDSEGYLFLAGRMGDTINRGGENVRPDEVEDVLRTHPAVREVAVVGVAERRVGEMVVAFVVRRDPDRPLDEDDLRRHARTALAGFKVPERWISIDELPRNAGGKVMRRTLAARVPQLGTRS